MGVHAVRCVCLTLVQMASVWMNGSSSAVNVHAPGLVHVVIQVSLVCHCQFQTSCLTNKHFTIRITGIFSWLFVYNVLTRKVV